MLEETARQNLQERLAENPYPGRSIVIEQDLSGCLSDRSAERGGQPEDCQQILGRLIKRFSRTTMVGREISVLGSKMERRTEYR